MNRSVRLGVTFAMAASVAMWVSPTAARAAEPKAATFEEAMANAQPVADLKDLFGPLFADCKRDDELEARQCAAVRDWLVASHREQTWVALGDEAALSFNPYDASEKKLEMEISGCIACGKPLRFDGDDKMHFVTTRVPKAIKAGRAVGLEVGFDDVSLADEKTAEAWEKKMAPRLRVQFVFKLGAAWKSGAFDGFTFVPVAHRIIDKCNGKVIASDPPSTADAQPMPDATCPVELTPAQKRALEDANLPDQLNTIQINQAMSTMRSRVHDCYNEFEVEGTAVVRLVVTGDGKLESVLIQPPFDKTPTGYCLRTALKSLTLPRFKGEKMVITYPFKMQ